MEAVRFKAVCFPFLRPHSRTPSVPLCELFIYSVSRSEREICALMAHGEKKLNDGARERARGTKHKACLSPLPPSPRCNDVSTLALPLGLDRLKMERGALLQKRAFVHIMSKVYVFSALETGSREHRPFSSCAYTYSRLV